METFIVQVFRTGRGGAFVGLVQRVGTDRTEMFQGFEELRAALSPRNGKPIREASGAQPGVPDVRTSET